MTEIMAVFFKELATGPGVIFFLAIRKITSGLRPLNSLMACIINIL
jgi:hypothetical protein